MGLCPLGMHHYGARRNSASSLSPFPHQYNVLSTTCPNGKWRVPFALSLCRPPTTGSGCLSAALASTLGLGPVLYPLLMAQGSGTGAGSPATNAGIQLAVLCEVPPCDTRGDPPRTQPIPAQAPLNQPTICVAQSDTRMPHPAAPAWCCHGGIKCMPGQPIGAHARNMAEPSKLPAVQHVPDGDSAAPLQ